MSRLARGLLGGLLGAILVLLAYPFTRNTLIGPVMALGPSPALASSGLVASRPYHDVRLNDRIGSSFGLLLACREMGSGRKIATDETKQLVRAAQKQFEAEPENAFWPQMMAVLLRRSDPELSRHYWLRASRLSRWDDGQGARLRLLLRQMEGELQSSGPWVTVPLYEDRLDYHVVLLRNYAEQFANEPVKSEPDMLLNRVTSIRNAKLIRDGSRKQEIGALAIEAIFSCTSGQPFRRTSSYRQLLQERQHLLDRLQSHKLLAERAEMESIYRSSDAWTNIVDSDTTQKIRSQLFLEAYLFSVLPPALLLVLGPGLLLASLGFLLERAAPLQAIFLPSIFPFVGIAIGAGTYLGSGLTMAGIACTACCALYLISPKNLRRQASPSLERPALYLVVLFALLCTITLTLWMMQFPASTVHCLPLIRSLDQSLVGSSAHPWIILVLLCLLLALAPIWSFKVKKPVPEVATALIMQLGITLCLTAAIGAVAATLACVVFERNHGDTLWRLLLNEPNFRMSR